MSNECRPGENLINPAEIRSRNDLLQRLSDDPLGDVTASLTGNGPVLFNLGVLNGPEWECVRSYLQSLPERPKTELQALEQDLRVADTNSDGFINNQEVVAFVQANPTRWANVAIFRAAADSYLNRLPGYLSQPNLNEQQVSRLWGVMNYFAQKWDEQRVDPSRRGTLYGLSLQGFPSSDRNAPPPLIRRAMNGQLTPEELAAVHQVLQIERGSDGRYNFGGAAPLNPEEIGMLGQLLEGAAQRGHSLHGMTLMTGVQEQAAFAARDQAARQCMDNITSANAGRSERGLAGAVQDCNRAMTPIEADHPERISTTTLTMRAFMGDLTPGEVSALRVWMREEAQAQGLTCNGALDCLKMGFLRFFKSIADNPWHFIARNGAFITGAYLYRRFVLQNVVANRIGQICGAPVGNPRQAYRDYGNFVRDQMRQRGFLRNLPRRVLQNPYVGLAAFNFAIAPLKDTGNLGVDILTDQLLLPFTFEAFETWDAFRNQQMMQQFVQQNPGLCQPKTQPQTAEAPAPEPVFETEAAAELAAKPMREYTQADFESYLQPQLLEQTFAHTPLELSPLLMGDEGRDWRATYDQIEGYQRNPSALADLLVGQYAKDSLADAQIRQGVTNLMTAFPTGDMRGLVPTFRWALQTYLRGLETGEFLTGEWIAQIARPDGIARTNFSIHSNMDGAHVSFEQGAALHWEMVDTVANHGVRPIRSSTATELSSEFNFVFEEFEYMGGKSWDDHQALERVLPHAGDLLAARFASEDPALAQRIHAEMEYFSTLYGRYGTHEQPITSEATSSYKWALREYINALSAGRTPETSSLIRQIGLSWSPRQVYFREQERLARVASNAEHERRYNSDPAYRAQQDAMGQYEAEMNARLDPMSGLPGGPMVLPLINGLPAIPSFSFGPVFSPAPIFAIP